MKRSRFNESQIISILKQVEGGRTVKEVCREHGMSDATYYNWKAKYVGMDTDGITNGCIGFTVPWGLICGVKERGVCQPATLNDWSFLTVRTSVGRSTS